MKLKQYKYHKKPNVDLAVRRRRGYYSSWISKLL